MLGLEEMAAILITLIALQGFAMSYIESSAAFYRSAGAFSAGLKLNNALNRLSNLNAGSSALTGILRSAAGCTAYPFYIGVALNGSPKRVIVSDGNAYVVYCNESTDYS
ncbi:MAG: hypothetical protein QXR73_03765 [Candidatus Micrarchaeaceae archaeon]